MNEIKRPLDPVFASIATLALKAHFLQKHLKRLTIFTLPKDRAQPFMTIHKALQRRRNSLNLKLPLKTPSKSNVIRRELWV